MSVLRQWYLIEGINPLPWKPSRASVARKKGGMYSQFHKDPELAGYQAAVQEELRQQYFTACIADEALELYFYFWRQLAPHNPENPRSRPHRADATNLQKALEDALQGVLFKNDRQIVHIESWIIDQETNTLPMILIATTNMLSPLPDVQRHVDAARTAQRTLKPQEPVSPGRPEDFF